MERLIALLSASPTTDLITPTDRRYDVARRVYNRMHDCYPSLIVRTLDVADLRAVIDFASAKELVLAIRGGGHHIGGFGTCNGGIVIDFSEFKKIHVDLNTKIASVSPGARLCDLDRALVPHGVIVPTGTVSDTGIAGLTLGGGIGWLIGRYGLTCDQLCGADVLLADGRLVRAEDEEYSDLLWALRGGGGNFGIVLNFRYSLSPLPKTICGSGIVAWQNVSEVMKTLLMYLMENCPPSMTVAPVFAKNSSGVSFLRIDFCCADGGQEDVEKLLALSSSVQWQNVKEWNFIDWQKEFDGAFLPPLRGYWKASYAECLSLETIQKLCSSFENAPTRECSILIEHLHGAFKTYDRRLSSFPLRRANFGILFSARWLEAAEDQANIHWVRESFKSIDPLGRSGSYSNYTNADDDRATRTLLSDSMHNVAMIKSRYDPANLFRRNHNVLPSRAT